VTDLVFDNTALSHFARAGRLSELELLTSTDICTTPNLVLDEVVRGIGEHSKLGAIVGLPWLRSTSLVEFEEVKAFATYKGAFGGGPDKNNGEAAVLAWVLVHGGTAIVDDEVARNAGIADGIEVHGSLWLIIRGFKRGTIDRATAEAIVDDLIGTEMRLPVDSGRGLFAWAYQAGLLPGDGNDQ
jgi:predicted nucleic acid-binding protein